MKIAIISPNPHHLQEFKSTLSAHRVSLIEGGKSKMRAVAEQEQPDLMIVEGMCCDVGELVQVEHVTTHHPRTAVILLCANLSQDFLLNAMRAGVREVLPSPVTPDALQAAVSRLTAKFGVAHTTHEGKVLAFMSCKGGSGATFFATNLGYQLARSKSVLLIDLNLQFGDALSFVHDGKPSSTLADVARDIGRLDATLLSASSVQISPTFSILAAPEDPAQSMEIKPEHIDAILKLAVTQYDFVLVDIARTLDIVSIRALDHAFRIYPVLQLSLSGLRNGSKLLASFTSLGYPTDRLEIIVNRYEKSGEISLEDARRALGPVAMRTIPNSYREVATSINRGNALSETSRSNSVTKALEEMMLSLNPKQEDSRGIFNRLFKRN